MIDLFIIRNKESLNLAARSWYKSAASRDLKIWFGEPDDVQVENVDYMYATNIETADDYFLYDAVVDCRLTAVKRVGGCDKRAVVSQRLTMQYKATYENGVMLLMWLSTYPGNAIRNNHREYPADADLVPIITKDDFDKEAERFLRIYCPEALINPQPVPIMDILINKMGLRVLKDASPIEGAGNGQPFGQIFFSPTPVKFQCPAAKAMKTGIAPRGTVVYNTSAMYSDSQGLINYSLTHEGVHWHRHRMHAALRGILYGEPFIACRNSKIVPIESKWTSERRLDWHAEKITPRILMPKEQFKQKARELFTEHNGTLCPRNKNVILDMVIKELADFFIVSKESVRIRMEETGLLPSNNSQNSRGAAVTPRISAKDAFREYCGNEDFREIVDSGAVRYVEGMFILNHPRYLTREGGDLRLTAFARRHLNECALAFTLREVYAENPRSVKGVMYRDNKTTKKSPHFEHIQNAWLEYSSKDELKQLHEQCKNSYTVETVVKPTFKVFAKNLMKEMHWNSETFKKFTGLSDTAYHRITSETHYNVSVQTAASICFGMNLDDDIVDKLFAAEGLTSRSPEEKHHYRFAVKVMRGRPFEQCSIFLESLGYPPLGSNSYCEKELM